MRSIILLSIGSYSEMIKSVGKGIDMPKVILEENLFGKCDYCKKNYPIGDGLNFSLVGKNWICRECEAEGVWA